MYNNVAKDIKINLKSTHALIVDSNEFARGFTRGICQSLGFGDIFTAGDAAKALNILANNHIDVVICDWILLPGGGEDFIRQVRTSAAVPDRTIPIIILTGVSNIGTIIAARNVGINDFLVRPIKLHRLVACLETALGNPKPFIHAGAYTGPDRRRKNPTDIYRGPERRAALQTAAVPESRKASAEKMRDDKGMSVEEMIAAGERVIAEAHAGYAGVRLQDLNDLFSLIRVLKEPGSSPREILKKIYLKANDIKSLGVTFGFPLLTTAGELLCELLEDLPPDAVKTLFVLQAIETHATVMKMVVDANVHDETDEFATDLVDGLRALVAKAEEKKVSGAAF